MLAYYVVKFFSWIMCVAPKCLRNLTAAILGGIAVVATPKWRMQMAAANIQECLGVDKARAQQIAEKSLRRFGRMVVEVMRFPLLNKDNITKLVNVEGLEYLEEAYKQNKGVIIATGHFGNWELLGATIALHGYPMLSITRKQNNKYMDRFINEYREMANGKANNGTYEAKMKCGKNEKWYGRSYVTYSDGHTTYTIYSEVESYPHN